MGRKGRREGRREEGSHYLAQPVLKRAIIFHRSQIGPAHFETGSQL